MAAPRIGIVSNFDRDRHVYYCYPAYVRAIEAAGGVPFLLPYLRQRAAIDDLLSLTDGVLLSGGGDLATELYGGQPHPALEAPNAARDEFEIALARAVLARDIPVLGICRGLQTLNVASGGSLHPDLQFAVPGALNHQDDARLDQPVHAVAIEAGTRLAALCRTDIAHVNSSHHQAVERVAQGFRVAAHATDGVIEAIESTLHKFAIGVQWHPERLWGTEPVSERLLRAFVAASGDRLPAPPASSERRTEPQMAEGTTPPRG